MKLKHFLVMTIAVASTLISCKNQDQKVVSTNDSILVDNIIEEATINRVPNNSDEHFSEALKAYNTLNKSEAAMHIREGMKALNEEGKNVSGLYKVNLETAIEQLDNIALKLENNFFISVEGFKEAVANAEINIAHNYLSTTDVFILEHPNNIASSKLRKHYSHNLSELKKVESEIKKEAKEEGEILLKEGKDLEKEYLEWEAKLKAHTQKSDEHLKKHFPQSYEEWIWVNQ